MLRSMTGFGTASGKLGIAEYTVEARSVNNRYVKVSLKLPEAWSGAEADIERIVREYVARGTVTLTVRMKIAEAQAAYTVNTTVLSSYLDQLKVLEMEGDPNMRIDLAGILQLPGVCEPPEMDKIIAESRQGLYDLIAEALQQMVKMRAAEGEALKADLLANCEAIDSGIAAVRQRAPVVVQEYAERLIARVKELVDSARVSLDSETLAREVALFAERSDIAEEIHRLGGHVEQFREALDSGEAVGRKLDFIAQEMLREANTMASKSNDAEIGRAVVDLKTAIDRIKEQVQNAE